MLKKVYIEITNVCNLSCSFCHGTVRERRFMSTGELTAVLDALRGHTQYVYFHLMGEPLLHPELESMLALAGECGFRVVITTNGTLLDKCAGILLASDALHRVNISLQSFERDEPEEYVRACATFAEKAARAGKFCSLRLWNGGADNQNDRIIPILEEIFPPPWREPRQNILLAERVFLDVAERFDWPDLGAPESGADFCMGLRDHIGILCDGTVVPCCLDADGVLALGNIFERPLADILASPQAMEIYEGFSRRQAVRELCRRCGYARKFK